MTYILIPGASIHDKELPQDTQWGEQWNKTAGLSNFHQFASPVLYTGFGPDVGTMYISGFKRYDGLDNGYLGTWPVEEQPTLPDVPAYLRRFRR